MNDSDFEDASIGYKSSLGRRSFLGGVSVTLAFSALSAWGKVRIGSGPSNAPVLLPTAAVDTTLRAVATQSAEPVQGEISPSSAWTGVAGSGYSVVPNDPLRQTAKPAMRLIVPPNQAFTDSILVGVAAFANDSGSLRKNLGIRSVIVHYEGNQVEITQPSYEAFSAANGTTVCYLGWWIRLKHDSRNGDANVFFEAIPNDSSMQRRVMGPYLFMPSAAQYDLELTVAPSMPEITGSRYASIRAALAYSARQRKNCPRITLVEPRNDYTLDAIGFFYTTGKGYATIEASTPVTIIATAFAPAGPRTLYDGLRFCGQNITIDHQYMETIYHEGRGNQHWFDGVKIISTGGSGYINPTVRGPKTYSVARNNPWFTECNISSVPNMVIGASLVRGCKLADATGDIFTDARCAVGNHVENFDSSEFWAKDVPAFTVSYIGDGATATLELTNYSDANIRIFTAKVNSVTVGTLQVTKSGSTASPCSLVVNWLNSLSGFRATLQNDTRRATMCSLENLKGGPFGPTSVKGLNLQIVTMVDLHSDVWQHLINGIPENVIVCDNIIKDHVGQCFFISSTTSASDFIFVNNCYFGKKVFGRYNNRDWMLSQIGGKGKKSHLVFAHNSSSQGWWFRTEQGFLIDSYSLFANNVAPNAKWVGQPSAQWHIKKNHFYAMTTTLVNSRGTTTGGLEDQIWPQAWNGDFTPAGALLSATSRPCIWQDSRARTRQKSDVPGAIAR